MATHISHTYSIYIEQLVTATHAIPKCASFTSPAEQAQGEQDQYIHGPVCYCTQQPAEAEEH